MAKLAYERAKPRPVEATASPIEAPRACKADKKTRDIIGHRKIPATSIMTCKPDGGQRHRIVVEKQGKIRTDRFGYSHKSYNPSRNPELAGIGFSKHTLYRHNTDIHIHNDAVNMANPERTTQEYDSLARASLASRANGHKHKSLTNFDRARKREAERKVARELSRNKPVSNNPRTKEDHETITEYRNNERYFALARLQSQERLEVDRTYIVVFQDETAIQG